MTHLALIGVLAGLIYGLRLSGLIAGTLPVHPAVRRILKFLPVALISALAASSLSPQATGEPLRLLAAAGALILGLKTGRMWLSILGGFAVYWALRAIV